MGGFMSQVVPIEKSSTEHEICDSIITYIISNQLSEGDFLPNERDFSAMLRVSRTSLREALKHLSFAGIITTIHGKGSMYSGSSETISAFYHDAPISIMLPSDVEFKSMIEVREVVEPAVTALAASRATSDDISALENSLKRLEFFLNADDPSGYQIEDVNFHILIANASKNSFFSQIGRIYLTSMLHLKSSNERMEVVHTHHINILDAIISGDSQKAGALSAEHVDFCRRNSES